MYNKQQIIEQISSNGQYIDAFMLDAFIKNWKIEAIYEDENGVEFFDDDAVEKIKTSLAPNEYKENYVHENIIVEEQHTEQTETTNEEITSENVEIQYETIEKNEDNEENEVIQEEIVEEPQIEILEKNVEVPVVVENPITENQVIETPKIEPEIKNVTLDITNQTLGVLAESIASKITEDIAQYLKNTDFLQEAMDMGAFKKDNEILAKKVQEIINDNKILVAKIKELESQKTDDYIHVFGNIYVKKNTK